MLRRVGDLGIFASVVNLIITEIARLLLALNCFNHSNSLHVPIVSYSLVSVKFNSRRNCLKNSTTHHHFSVNPLFPSSSKALFCKLFVVLALSAASTSAFGANLVSNPGFENGMTGWTTNPSHAWVASTQNVMFGSFDAANGSG